MQIAEGRYEGFYDCRRKVMQIFDSIYQGNDEERKKPINVTPFKYVWDSNPVDYWNNGILCSEEEKLRVILDMPEMPRDGEVYKTYLPGNRGVLEAVYMCKADNNGTTYMFADEEVACLSKDNVIRG